MSAKLPTNLKDSIVKSSIGTLKIDSEGAPIAGVRMDTSRAYAGIPKLLQKVINENSTKAWEEIIKKIDYIHDNLKYALSELEKETGFISTVQSQVKSGKKLFFKPNLVSPCAIDMMTHDEGLGVSVTTNWALIAALMRWFHDVADITYHQMALGEAASATSLFAYLYSHHSHKTVTTEAVIEGRNGNFYGGWGFFFVRKYLSERHPATHKDDPLKGYEDSVAGRYIPPGKAQDRLIVYDLNKLQDDTSKGRTVAVPEGANFKEITLHKAIVGGDPNDPDDLRDYPGCVLVGVPKLKMHDVDLITNAIKNFGIGLYPMQAPANEVSKEWKYSYPFTQVPILKCQLPHMPWVAKIDEETGLPTRNEMGEYIVTRTAGMPGTQADVIRATQSQNVLMLHVVDAIDTINLSHNDENASRVPEGYVWTSLDCVALDVLCARYCFKTVPMLEALKLKEENGWPTEFVHHVPVAKVSGINIVTEEGIDSPLLRYHLYSYAEERGVGQQKYYVVGRDSLTDTPLGSLGGHLGRIEKGQFIELMTNEMYYNSLECFFWDMQKTVLSYAKAHDILTGSSLLDDFMDNFDENGDGIIDYNEKGRVGFFTPFMRFYCDSNYLQITEKYGPLKSGFNLGACKLKYSDERWNPQGHDFSHEYFMLWIAKQAFTMSQAEEEHVDQFVKNMSWGKGKWPSWQSAMNELVYNTIYGSRSLMKIGLQSMYGTAFQYADKTMNGGAYSGSTDVPSAADSISKYHKAISEGSKLLDFTLYVPVGYGRLEATKIPNVEETDDSNKIFTVHFNGAQEAW